MARQIIHDDDDAIVEAPQLDVAALTNAAHEAGAQEQIGRFQAILADERSKGRERFCVNLACKAPAMTPADVLAVAADVPLAGEPERKTPTVAERAPAEIAAISSAPLEAPSEKPGASWNDPVSKTNARIKKNARSQARH